MSISPSMNQTAQSYFKELQQIQTSFSFSSRCHHSALKGLSIHAPPCLSAVFPILPSKQCQCLSGWTQFISDLGGWNVCHFLSLLLFPSGDQCCDALACPCSEGSTSLGAPLPCQAAERCDICCACQSICLFIPTDSGMSRAVDPQKSLQPKIVHGCVPVRAAHSRLHLLQKVHSVCENDDMCNLCITLGG